MHELEPTSASTFPSRHPLAPSLKPQSPEDRDREAHLEALDEDHLTSARALIDAKEFTRAVHWLRECKSAKALFLTLYSQYMVSNVVRGMSQTFDDHQIQVEREEGNEGMVQAEQ
jgi:anaphase-promoting complex subunit 8